MTPVSELDELSEALASAERELKALREQLHGEEKARLGDRLERLREETARVVAEAAEQEALNATAEERVKALHAKAAELARQKAELGA